MRWLACGLLLLAGCMTTGVQYTPAAHDQFQNAQRTPQQVWVFSDCGLSAADLASIDANVQWCQDHGLNLPKEQLTVDVVTGVLLRPGVYSYQDPQAGWIGGRVTQLSPVGIMVISQSLECIRHELLHVHLWRTSGTPDTAHVNPLWKVWPVY